MMSNLEAVKKWGELKSDPTRSKWAEGEIFDLIYLALEAYQSPIKPGPEPPKIKLEAGCWVRSAVTSMRGTVVVIYGDEACIKGYHSGALSIRSICNLTVTEAATPEVGDYAKLNGYKLFGTITSPPTASRQYCVICINGKSNDYHRNDFTLLQKAPKGLDKGESTG